MPDNRPSVYLEGDTVIYRASALGGCLKALFAARSGMDPLPLPPIVQSGMDEGTALEPTILEILYDKYHWTFGYSTQFQIELELGHFNTKRIVVRGALDEVGAPAATRKPQQYGPVDVKALTPEDCDKFRNHSFSAFPRYAWQQSAYAHGYGTDYFYMPIFNKGTWAIEEQTLSPHGYIYTPEQIRDRVMTIEEAYQDNVMPNDCPQDYGCPYPYLHEGKPRSDLPETSVPLARARIILSDKIRTLESARKALDQKIKSLLDQDISYELDSYTITVYANPSRFNTEAAKRILREADIDYESDPEFIIPGKGTQVRFTPPKKEHPLPE